MTLQVGVKILLEKDGGYLLLRRSEAVDHGGERLWDIPGGRIDESERLFDALSREVREETGLMLHKNTQILKDQDIFVENKNLHVVRLTYTGTADGKITLSSEHDAYEWMSKIDILAIDNLDPFLREVLEQ